MSAPRQFLSWGSICFALFAPAQALALQPLQQFLDAARQHNTSADEARANLDAARAQSDATLGRQLPSLSVRGTYQRNQYDVELPGQLIGEPGNLVLTPYNQFDATGTLSVPLIDLASFRRISASGVQAEAAQHSLDSAMLQVEAQVVQSYYQLVADEALVGSAQRALDVAKANQSLTHTRVQAGQSPMLEQDRADAQVEQQVQLLTAAELQLSVAAESMRVTSGLAPQLGTGETALKDDLHEEPPLEQFAAPAEGTPGEAVAISAREVADRQAQAAKLQLAPTLTGSLSEHVGNYATFSGQKASFTGVLALVWSLDYTTFANMRAAEAQAVAAQSRVDAATLQTNQAIHNAWAAVHAAIARSRSAKVQAQVSQHAQQLAKDRYEAGASTQLDLLQAERDAFAADVARIQSDADLANARAQLQLSAGRDPYASGGKP